MLEITKDSVTGWTSFGNYSNVFVPRSIDVTCPHCHRSPVNFALSEWDIRGDSWYASSRCPGCNNQSRFWIINGPNSKSQEHIDECSIFMYPVPLLQRIFEEGITKISPTFVEVYNQSLRAEKIGLNLLNGIGYRKALEFLIKDYTIYKNPDKSHQIQSMTLMNCIKTYIDDQRIKDCAERTVWLGNDETHYIRKWTDHDINDLKLLLDLTVYWISSAMLTEKYLDRMKS